MFWPLFLVIKTFAFDSEKSSKANFKFLTDNAKRTRNCKRNFWILKTNLGFVCILQKPVRIKEDKKILNMSLVGIEPTLGT